ncbi:hypothetical protein DIPPA_22885 [Diplonema papillatum]|nr:hypothetical protein DIPPA_22885 [Diplonema papillatum]KAJ9472310.1 hypothetical protein DIPPA_22885 [Diplonema papillatum]
MKQRHDTMSVSREVALANACLRLSGGDHAEAVSEEEYEEALRQQDDRGHDASAVAVLEAVMKARAAKRAPSGALSRVTQCLAAPNPEGSPGGSPANLSPRLLPHPLSDSVSVVEHLMRKRDEKGQEWDDLRAALKRLLSLDADSGKMPAEAAAPLQEQRHFTLEELDRVFRAVAACDTYVSMVKDGVSTDDAPECSRVSMGIDLVEYTRTCRQGCRMAHAKLLAMMRESEKVRTSETDVIEAYSKRVPAEISAVLIKWLLQLSRTSSLLGSVAQLVLTRDSEVATEHEKHLVDSTGLVVSTVTTPTALSGSCSILERNWMGRPLWTPAFAVLWQQILYLFPSDDTRAKCMHCILLRGATIAFSTTLLSGKHNVLRISDYLAPYSPLGPTPFIFVSFDKNHGTWVDAVRQAVAAPPIRDVEVFITAVRDQADMELSLEEASMALDRADRISARNGCR